MMVGREVLLRVEKTPAAARRAAARGRATCTCSTTAGSRRCAASRSQVRAGEIVGIAGVDGNGQTELIEAITGLRRVDERARSSSPASDVTTRARATMLDAGRRPHPRGPAAPRPRARVLARREHRAARLRHAAGLAAGAGSSRAGSSSAARRLIRSSTSAAAGRRRRAGGALGRQPAEGRRRARDRARPEGADRRAADARPRRRRDRVRAPPARRASATRGARSCSSRSSSTRSFALRPDPRHLRGRDRRRARPPTRPRRSSASRCSAAGGKEAAA